MANDPLFVWKSFLFYICRQRALYDFFIGRYLILLIIAIRDSEFMCEDIKEKLNAWVLIF